MLIGIIADTHGLIRPSALAALAGSDLIIHAGDVGKSEVIDALAVICPVIAVRGNCDTGALAASLRETETIHAGEAMIRIIHDLKQLRGDPAAEGVEVVICGHSHRPFIERRGSVLYVNPGSAGRRRFHLPVTVAHLLIERGVPEAMIITLEEGADP